MIKPINDSILVRPDPAKPAGLIITPPEDTFSGIVVAVGPGKKLSSGKIRKMMVSVGDHVLYSGTVDKHIDGLLLMKDMDVIGTL